MEWSGIGLLIPHHMLQLLLLLHEHHFLIFLIFVILAAVFPYYHVRAPFFTANNIGISIVKKQRWCTLIAFSHQELLLTIPALFTRRTADTYLLVIVKVMV